MITHIDHINIVAADLERSVRFYTEMLGFRETRRATLTGDWIESIVGLRGVEADVVYVVAPGGEPRIELIHYRAPSGTALPANSQPNTHGLRHIAFRVEDIHAEFDRLSTAGVEFVGPPVAVPDVVISHDAGRKLLCYFHDPDGVVLELAEYQ